MSAGTETTIVAAKRTIAEVRAKNYEFYATERGHGALKDLQQTFPHPWLYVGELLQNAVDAGAKKIRLAVGRDTRSLVIEHDGAAFDTAHVEALCVRGMSKKGAGTVGFMGIGFKAVFQSFESVDVSSGPWRFRFRVKEVIGEFGDRQRDWLGCVLPEYVGEIDSPTPGMKCRFVLRDRLDRLGPIEADVANVLSADLTVLALLARRGVEEIEWEGEQWKLDHAEEALDQQTLRIVLTAQHNGQERRWVMFSAKYQPSREAIARFLEHRQIQPKAEERDAVYAEARRERFVEVFCPLDSDGLPEPPRNGEAYALLPTGVTVPVGLHVQADWLLVTSRRELMEVETNQWHREILARLADLLRSYLAWVTGLQDIPESRLTDAYAVLPEWSEPDAVFGGYLKTVEFRDSLKQALSTLAFLPARTTQEVRFLSPTEAKVLPVALRVFDEARLLPSVLFGDDLLSTGLLGARTLAALEGLKLLAELTPAALADRWGSGAVGSWREQLGSIGMDSHLRLLRALAALDDMPVWKAAQLHCLPTATGVWVGRRRAVALPAEWDSVPDNDPSLQQWLEPFVAPGDRRLDWTFDRAVRRDTGAQQYIAQIERHRLDDVLGAWWAALPQTPDAETRAQVLDVTCWVLAKQRQRPGLVLRVLREDETLAPLTEVVLADPYAARARRRFFPELSAVSGTYLHHKPGYSDADWRSFFEAANKTISGPCRLKPQIAELSWTALKKALPSYNPPGTKSVPIRARWSEVTFSSDNYLLVDMALPDELTRVVEHMGLQAIRDIGLWLHETRQDLIGSARLRIAYVPYNSSSVYVIRTEFAASWVTSLQNTPWLAASDGSGPHLPENVLPRVDQARPDAPIADLTEELVQTLESCGIQFGSSLPDVASIERLRREGPSADTSRLVELLETAISDAGEDIGRREDLLRVLTDCLLVPVPLSVQLIDRASRVSANRLVQRSARGGELGGWLLSVEATTKDLSEDDSYSRLTRLVGSVHHVPDAPTWPQALSFLRWVWRVQPDAELVRRTLPRVYRLIAEEDAADPFQPDAWAAAVADAVVYTANRRWVSVANENLFLDDLGDDRLKNVIGGLSLATPGHLGETTDEQHRVASLLGVRLLSSRYKVILRPEGVKSLPLVWEAAIGKLMDLLQSYAQEEDGEWEPLSNPEISYHQRIVKAIVVDGEERNAWEVHAARHGELVFLSGDPDDFAADFCRVLLQWAGLANRRDLDELAPTLTQLIGWVDRPNKFSAKLAEVGLKDAAPTAEEPVPAADDSPSQRATEQPQEGSGASVAQAEDAASPRALKPGAPESGASTDITRDEVEDADTDTGLVPAPAPSGGHTSDDRERRLQSLRRLRAELDSREKQLLGVGPLPDEPVDEDADARRGKFASDLAYREAALAYERRAGRYPVAKDDGQPGHDIDSFNEPLDNPERRLVRRIEVKGHGCAWNDDETVELSDRQFLDALEQKCDDEVLADDFDYWLYVVERRDDGALEVIAIRNPASRTAKFEFRSATWRALAAE